MSHLWGGTDNVPSATHEKLDESFDLGDVNMLK